MGPQSILVPLDFSAPSIQAFDYAVALAGVCRARMTLLHVIPPLALGSGLALGMGPMYADLLAQAEADADSAMEGYVQRLREAGLEGESIVIHGAPFQQIVDTATTRQVDLIVMATHGHTGLQRFLLGSVAEKVVRLAPCPVLVTRSQEADATA